MNIIERAKNIIVKPKEEWEVIDQEQTPVSQLVTSYLIPLALIPTIASFVRYAFLGYGFMGPLMDWGIKYAVITFIANVGGAFISAFVIDALATSFGSTRDFRKSMQLVVYSFTPFFLAGIFQLIPHLGFLAIVGLYGLYLLYLGFKPMMKTPEDKVIGYFVVSLLVIIVVYFILTAIFGAILVGSAVTRGLIVR